MDKYLAKKYYSRPDIQKAIVKFAKDREIGVMFDGFFGKRPDIIENTSDLKKLVNKGVLSFHGSEERWLNPLLLGDQNQSDEERNKNRIGWDLILDLDGVQFEYSQIVGKLIIDFLEELGVHNTTVKFSGNKGFHIGVPFEAFSANIIGLGETRLLFPEVARKIAAYIMYELKGKISKSLLEYEGSFEEIAQKHGFDLEELTNDDEDSLNFDFMKVIEIDTILIASRHLFRAPYSLNEKSGLASIPIPKHKIMEFKKFWAKPQRVLPEKHSSYYFLKYDEKYGKDADVLLIKSYEEDYIEEFSKDVLDAYSTKKKSNQVIEITEEVTLNEFPESITYILNNSFSDGRKRLLFVLLTFLYGINWSQENVESLIEEWNEKQENPLKKNYLSAQFSWFALQQKKISTPNYDNSSYYRDLGVPKEIIEKDMNKFRFKAKNPLHYVYLLMRKKDLSSNK